MAQRFISLEDAATQLSISKDRLGQLRDANKVRAYRDGASWKFRAEDIEKLASEGIPNIDPGASDLSMSLDDDFGELEEAAELDEVAELADVDDDAALDIVDDLDEEAAVESEPAPPSPAMSGLDMELADESPVEGPASDLGLEEVDEPTVAGIDEGSDNALAIDLDSDSISLSDSILLSESELGGSIRRPPSTIIGKSELDLDADLDLSGEPTAGPASDVRLAASSDIIGLGDDDLGIDLPSPSGDFEDLPEVDIDLEAQSSRILSPEDVAKVKGAMSSSVAAATSDLELAPTDSDPAISTSDINLGGSMASGTGLTGLSALELDDEDDQVLGEGSDVTLSGESSGINIISPSDSGLALDEVNLDLSGSSPIGSSLDLGGSGIQEVSLEPLMVGEGISESIGEDFQLTPLGEEDVEDEEKDSSQVIALEEISEDAGVPLGRGVSVEEEGMMGEDFGVGVGLAPGVVPVGVAPVDTPFSTWNVMGLASCLMLLSLCGMMAYDLLRNLWSWNDVTPLNSSLLEVLNPFL